MGILLNNANNINNIKILKNIKLRLIKKEKNTHYKRTYLINERQIEIINNSLMIAYLHMSIHQIFNNKTKAIISKKMMKLKIKIQNSNKMMNLKIKVRNKMAPNKFKIKIVIQMIIHNELIIILKNFYI
jgi:hypothetical protein